jgi:hypothetical protein
MLPMLPRCWIIVHYAITIPVTILIVLTLKTCSGVLNFNFEADLQSTTSISISPFYSSSYASNVSRFRKISPDFSFRLPSLPPISVSNCTISQNEFIALESFYNSLNGPSWVYRNELFNYKPWSFPANSSSPCTDHWYGVICDYVPLTNNETCYVQQLQLIYLNLQGTLPAEMSLLKNTSSLVLSFNKIGGGFPTSILSLSKLELLDLCFNPRIVGTIPKEISNLVNLRYMFMYSCNLLGSIPSEFGSLKLLKLFDLDTNSLTGSIPATLGQMEMLEQIYLYKNSIKGTLPSELSSLNNLNTLDIDSNSLTGTIPSQLSVLKSLAFIFLFNNMLSGPISKNFFIHMTYLAYFQVNNNMLSSTLPNDLGNLGYLRYIDISHNFFESTLPNSYTNLINLQGLVLASNSLTGTFPNGLSQIGIALRYLDVSSNELYGNPFIFTGFPFLINVNVSNNHFDDMDFSEEFNFSAPISFNVSSTINCTRVNEKFPFLKDSCNKTISLGKKSLDYLDISNNYLGRAFV